MFGVEVCGIEMHCSTQLYLHLDFVPAQAYFIPSQWLPALCLLPHGSREDKSVIGFKLSEVGRVIWLTGLVFTWLESGENLVSRARV